MCRIWMYNYDKWQMRAESGWIMIKTDTSRIWMYNHDKRQIRAESEWMSKIWKQCRIGRHAGRMQIKDA